MAIANCCGSWFSAAAHHRNDGRVSGVNRNTVNGSRIAGRRPNNSRASAKTATSMAARSTIDMMATGTKFIGHRAFNPRTTRNAPGMTWLL